MSSTYGNVKYAKTKTATLVGQYKKPMKGQIHIGAAFQKKNGKILPYLCIPVPVTGISLTCRASKSLWSKSVPLRESVGKNSSTLISLGQEPGESTDIKINVLFNLPHLRL